MPIIAKWQVTHNQKTFKPGDEIIGLSSSEINRLLGFKAVEIVGDLDTELQNSEITPGQPEEIDEKSLFQSIIKDKMKRPDLMAYATKVKIPYDVKMKNTDIEDAILADAEKNGIDLEALEDEHLRIYAVGLGIEAAESMSREDLLDAVNAE